MEGIEKDKVLNSVLGKMYAKYRRGADEHGGGLDGADLSIRELAVMMQEEAIDQAMYCEALIQRLDKDAEDVSVGEAVSEESDNPTTTTTESTE